MNEKLYGMMKWPDIEGIEYCDQRKPASVLGPHMTPDGLLIQAFVPDAKSVKVNLTTQKKSYMMEKMDDAGFFAVLIDSKTNVKYKLEAEYESGDKYEYWDPYEFETTIKEEDINKFNAGICYEAYNILGAHVRRINNVTGVEFCVWAPFALRVSVVGEFNEWDGRKHQMSEIGESGVFTIFVPGVKEGALYKYEIKKKGDENIIKSDPYEFASEVDGGTASVVKDVTSFKWDDTKWMNARKKADLASSAMSIYELHIPTWFKDEKKTTLSDVIEDIVKYVTDMNYTHVEIMPVMCAGDEGKEGYCTKGFYAIDSRVCTIEELMKLVNELHKKNIGVIFDWAPNGFSSDKQGMRAFDGTCLYEHEEYKKGVNPRNGTYVFNYARPEVTSFLIANALYWINVFHADGIKVHSVASMLYLDYDRQPGEWVANIYGGNENLDAIEFLKHLNSILKKKTEGVAIIADDNSGYPELTGEVSEECMGFDFKLNEGWKSDVINYMGVVPYLRNQHYNEISLSMLYQYADSFIVGFLHDDVTDGKASMIGRMTGDTEERKFANLRATYGYMYVHPGKKHMFMGQDFAQYEPWDVNKVLDWKILDEDMHKQINNYVRELNKLYTSEKALYELDNYESGFEWINNISARESVLVFARKGKTPDDILVVVCNFDDVDREDYKIGVPAVGKYKEIFNSDRAEFGGNGFVNPRLKQSKTDECDGRPESIRINVPALGITVLKYSKADEKVTGNAGAKSKAKAKSETKKTTASAKKPAKSTAKTVVKAETKTTAKSKTETVEVKPVKKETKLTEANEKKTKNIATKAIQEEKKEMAGKADK